MSQQNQQFAYTLAHLAAHPDDAKMQLRFALGLYEISDLQSLLSTVIEAILTVTGMERGYVMLGETGQFTFPVVRNREKRKLKVDDFSFSHTIVNKVLEERRVYYSREAKGAHMSDSARLLQLKTVLCLPLLVRHRQDSDARALGVIYADSRRLVGRYTDEQLELFQILAGHAAMAIENARLYQMATVDSLTQLYLRHFVLGQFRIEWSRAQRHRLPLAVVMMDIDHFKRVNDEHGHPKGDEVLRAVAATLKSKTRNEDLLARYGGEEFLLILPATELSGARVITGRLCDAVRKMTLPYLTTTVTISAGIAATPIHQADSPEELIAKADQAMYLAKSGGRDRICVHSD